MLLSYVRFYIKICLDLESIENKPLSNKIAFNFFISSSYTLLITIEKKNENPFLQQFDHSFPDDLGRVMLDPY